MFEVRMPRLNSNDETGILDRWLVEDGRQVTAETVIAAIETSKANYDLMSEAEGVLQHLVEEGEEYPVGKLIAYVFRDQDERSSFLAGEGKDLPGAASPGDEASAPAGLVITRAAGKLIAELGLSEVELLSLGKKVIKRSDLDAWTRSAAAGKADAAAGMIELPRRQRTIAETVSRSHTSIPRAFTAIKLPCDAALEDLAELAERDDIRAGLPELLVRTLGALREELPFFYGQVVEGHRFQPAPAADVGVTIDVGRGLFIPVVRSPATKSVGEIADILMEFRIKALRNTFQQQELTGGAITLSLNNDGDVLIAEPLILPGQSCMVSLGALQTELVRGGDGKIVERKVAHLGLSYDHRVINGSDGVGFLQAVKKGVESRLAGE